MPHPNDPLDPDTRTGSEIVEDLMDAGEYYTLERARRRVAPYEREYPGEQLSSTELTGETALERASPQSRDRILADMAAAERRKAAQERRREARLRERATMRDATPRGGVFVDADRTVRDVETTQRRDRAADTREAERMASGGGVLSSGGGGGGGGGSSSSGSGGSSGGLFSGQ